VNGLDEPIIFRNPSRVFVVGERGRRGLVEDDEYGQSLRPVQHCPYAEGPHSRLPIQEHEPSGLLCPLPQRPCLTARVPGSAYSRSIDAHTYQPHYLVMVFGVLIGLRDALSEKQCLAHWASSALRLVQARQNGWQRALGGGAVLQQLLPTVQLGMSSQTQELIGPFSCDRHIKGRNWLGVVAGR